MPPSRVAGRNLRPEKRHRRESWSGRSSAKSLRAPERRHSAWRRQRSNTAWRVAILGQNGRQTDRQTLVEGRLTRRLTADAATVTLALWAMTKAAPAEACRRLPRRHSKPSPESVSGTTASAAADASSPRRRLAGACSASVAWDVGGTQSTTGSSKRACRAGTQRNAGKPVAALKARTRRHPGCGLAQAMRPLRESTPSQGSARFLGAGRLRR